MKIDQSTLQNLLPSAISWVKEQESFILQNGFMLDEKQMEDARSATVSRPEQIRILFVSSISPPSDPLLADAAAKSGLIGPGTIGFTMRNGIYIREDYQNYQENRELYVHEFAHVGQYERWGSIERFLSDYLSECIDPGYPNGVMEQGAAEIAKNIVDFD